MTAECPTALLDMIELRGPVDDAISAARELHAYPATKTSSVVLTRVHLISVLDACRAGRMDEGQLQRWAQAVRLHIARGARPGRHRFLFEPGHDRQIGHVVYTLAAERHTPYPPGLIDDLRELLDSDAAPAPGRPANGPLLPVLVGCHLLICAALIFTLPVVLDLRLALGAVAVLLSLLLSLGVVGIFEGLAAASAVFHRVGPFLLGLTGIGVILNAVGWLP